MPNYGNGKDENYYLTLGAIDKVMTGLGAKRVTDVDEIQKVLSESDNFIERTSDRIGAMASGAGRNMVEYASSGAKLAGLDDVHESLENTRRNMQRTSKTSLSDSWKNNWDTAGSMVYDPINLLPAGILTKGAKGAKVLKSMGMGAGLGATTSIAKDYGNEDVSSSDMATNAMISGAMWGGMNGVFASEIAEKIFKSTGGKYLSDKLSSIFKRAKREPNNVTPDDISTLNEIKNNPEMFGLTPEETKYLPAPIMKEAEPTILESGDTIHLGMNKPETNTFNSMGNEEPLYQRLYRKPQTKQEALDLLLRGEKPFDEIPITQPQNPLHVSDDMSQKGDLIDTSETPIQMSGEVQMASEALPSTSMAVGKTIKKMPIKKQQEYHSIIQNSMVDENGVDMVLKNLGLEQIESVGTKELVPSAYAGHTGAMENTRIKLDTTINEHGFEIPTQEALAKIQLSAIAKAVIQDQDAVTLRFLVPVAEKSENMNAIALRFKRSATHDEMKAMLGELDTLLPKDDQWAFAIASTKDGVDFLNIGLDQAKFKVVSDKLSNMLDTDFKRYFRHNPYADSVDGYMLGYGSDWENKAKELYGRLSMDKSERGISSVRGRNSGNTENGKWGEWSNYDEYSNAIFAKRDELRKTTKEFIKYEYRARPREATAQTEKLTPTKGDNLASEEIDDELKEILTELEKPNSISKSSKEKLKERLLNQSKKNSKIELEDEIPTAKADDLANTTDEIIPTQSKNIAEDTTNEIAKEEPIKLKWVHPDKLDNKGAFDIGKLKDGEMSQLNGEMVWKKNGEIHYYYDRPYGFDDMPEARQIVARQEYLDTLAKDSKGRKGFADSSIAQNLVAGGAGAGIGYTQGETNEERMRNALIGAGMGAGANSVISKILGKKVRTNPIAKPYPKTTTQKIKPKSIQRKAFEDTSSVKFGKGNDKVPHIIDTDGIKIKKEGIVRDGNMHFYSGAEGALAGLEQDEDGNITINPTKALMGIVGGAVLMNSAKKAFSSRREASTFIKKTITDTMSKQFSDITKTGHTLQDAYKEVRRATSNTLSAKYMDKRDVPIRVLNAEAEKFTRLHKGLNALDEETRKGIHRALVGEGKAPEGTEAFVASIRKQIDDFSEELVNEGILSREAMEEWKGYYLHRSYEKHFKDAIGQFKTGNTFRIDDVMARGKIKKVTQEQYAKMLENGEISEELLNKPLRKGGVRATQKGQMIELRRDYTASEREAMGEIQDASYTIPDTLMRMRRMVENAKFLKEVSKMSDNAKLTNNAILDDEAIKILTKGEHDVDTALSSAGFTKLPNKPVYGALAGKWLRKDVASDIRNMQDELHNTYKGEDVAWRRIWRGYLSEWKLSKTVLNIPTHFNNLTANLSLMHLAGISPLEMPKVYLETAKGLVGGKRYEELLTKEMLGKLSQSEVKELKNLKTDFAMYDEAKKMGLFGRSQLNDILRGDINIGAKGAYGKVKDVAGYFYQAEDALSRITMYSILRKKFGLSKEEARIASNSIMPDYTKPLPPFFRGLRDSGISPFVSWTYYVMPNVMKALATKDGATQAIKLMGLVGAIEYWGTDGEIKPWDNMPFVDTKKPSWFKGREMAFNKNGDKIDTMKIDKIIPYLGLQEPVNFIKSMGSGILPNFIATTLMDRKLYNGQPITRANKSVGDKAIDYSKYYAESFVPLPQQLYNTTGLIESLVRKEKSRKRNKVVQPRTKGQNIIKALAGVNTKTYSKSALRKEQKNK